MHSEALLDRARARTGLDHFGDPGFRDGLERLIASLDGEAALNEVGTASMEAMIVSFLAQRLEIEGWYARHPEIDDQSIGPMLVGIGLPRTGSTALACLLGVDAGSRSLRTWESQQPCPPPEAATYANDPRIAVAEAMMEQRARLFPRMTSMLPTTPTSPTECQTFMAYDFKSQLFQSFAHVPSYVAWLNREADLVPTYRYLERVLKLLQWRCPTRAWRIKNPSHSLFIDAFDQVFPQARFVMTHRSPVDVVPSVCDVYYELSRAYSDRVDPLAIGAANVAWCELAMRRMIEFRDGGAEDRFFDIWFAPFQRDPIATMSALYDWMGEELTPATREAMAEWRRTTPRDAGYARTDPAIFGLDAVTLAERFRFYTERFPAIAATPEEMMK